MQSAHHQILILYSERHYTAFEACGKLCQFLRAPFGASNGVTSFESVIDTIIQDEGLNLMHPFIDDVNVCGKEKRTWW